MSINRIIKNSRCKYAVTGRPEMALLTDGGPQNGLGKRVEIKRMMENLVIEVLETGRGKVN